MPIFRSAYDTTFGRRYSTEATKAAIVKATVSNYLAKNDRDFTIIEDTANIPVDIPSFTHPLFVERNHDGQLYVDARNFVSRNRQSGDLKISSVGDYNLLLARAGLEYLWRSQGPMVLRMSSALPASVYAAWLSENISKQYGLEPEDQHKLAIFSGWFYFSLFTDSTMPDEKEFQRVCVGIAKATRIEVSVVMRLLDGQAFVRDITDFCSRLEEVIGNIRFKGFSSITLYPILNSTWFGANSQELVAIAIEHPPTFQAIVLSAITEHSYMRSRLSKMIERVPAKGSIEEFKLHTIASLK